MVETLRNKSVLLAGAGNNGGGRAEGPDCAIVPDNAGRFEIDER